MNFEEATPRERIEFAKDAISNPLTVISGTDDNSSITVFRGFGPNIGLQQDTDIVYLYEAQARDLRDALDKLLG